MRNFLSSLFTLVGVILLLISGYLLWQRNNPDRLSFRFNEASVNVQHDLEFGNNNERNEELLMPIGIRIRSIGIELPIVYSRMINGQWETTDKGVSFLDTSAIPGEVGNSIMYGHNWSNILGNLEKVKPGDVIEIMYENGTIKNFSVEYVQEVSPSNSDILAKTEDRRITLYTCSGFLDSKRLAVTAFYY